MDQLMSVLLVVFMGWNDMPVTRASSPGTSVAQTSNLNVSIQSVLEELDRKYYGYPVECRPDICYSYTDYHNWYGNLYWPVTDAGYRRTVECPYSYLRQGKAWRNCQLVSTETSYWWDWGPDYTANCPGTPVNESLQYIQENAMSSTASVDDGLSVLCEGIHQQEEYGTFISDTEMRGMQGVMEEVVFLYKQMNESMSLPILSNFLCVADCLVRSYNYLFGVDGLIKVYNTVLSVVDHVELYDEEHTLIFPSIFVEIKPVFVATTLHVVHSVQLTETEEASISNVEKAVLIASASLEGVRPWLAHSIAVAISIPEELMDLGSLTSSSPFIPEAPGKANVQSNSTSTLKPPTTITTPPLRSVDSWDFSDYDDPTPPPYSAAWEHGGPAYPVGPVGDPWGDYWGYDNGPPKMEFVGILIYQSFIYNDHIQPASSVHFQVPLLPEYNGRDMDLGAARIPLRIAEDAQIHFSSEACTCGRLTDQLTCTCETQENVLFAPFLMEEFQIWPSAPPTYEPSPQTPPGGINEFLRFTYIAELMITEQVLRAISLVCLVLTVLTYAIFRKTRRGTVTSILMNLCFSLIAVIIIFYVTERLESYVIGCITASVLRTYFVLVSLMWNGVEAFNMYLRLVKVFDSNIERLTIKAALLSWGLPMVPIMIAFAVDVEAFNGYFALCQLVCSPKLLTLYLAFLLPMGIIILHNLIVFVLVMKQLTSHQKARPGGERRDKLVQLIGAIAMLALLGIPWIFGVFGSINPEEGETGVRITEGVFQTMFVVLVHTQGIFIFIFHCVRIPEVRSGWRSTFSMLTSQSTSSSNAPLRDLRSHSNGRNGHVKRDSSKRDEMHGDEETPVSI